MDRPPEQPLPSSTRSSSTSGTGPKKSQRRFSLLFVDIDWFKAYNDTYGHQAEDMVLATVARCGCQQYPAPRGQVRPAMGRNSSWCCRTRPWMERADCREHPGGSLRAYDCAHRKQIPAASRSASVVRPGVPGKDLDVQEVLPFGRQALYGAKMTGGATRSFYPARLRHSAATALVTLGLVPYAASTPRKSKLPE